MATDAPTLLALANSYKSYSNASTSQLLIISLLQQAVLALNPLADTTPQTLMLSVGSYKSYSNADTATLLIIGLLQLLVQNIGSGGGGSGTTCGNYGGGQPNFTPASGCALAIDTSNRGLWAYTNGAWNQLV